jgi:hypothetical protein
MKSAYSAGRVGAYSFHALAGWLEAQRGVNSTIGSSSRWWRLTAVTIASEWVQSKTPGAGSLASQSKLARTDSTPDFAISAIWPSSAEAEAASRSGVATTPKNPGGTRRAAKAGPLAPSTHSTTSRLIWMRFIALETS